MTALPPTSGALRLASWSPATDTHELRADLRGPFFERDTIVMPLLRPTVRRVDRRPLLLVLWLRVLASPAADHLRASARSTFWPAAAWSGLLLGVIAINYLAAGGYVSWDGFRAIPTGGAR